MKRPVAAGILAAAALFGGAADGLAQGSSEMISAGEVFVQFELPADDGSIVTSDDLTGHPYLLFFYPKAATPG